MKDEKNKKTNDETASDFVDHQRVLDDAKNERIKAEKGNDKLDPKDANNPARRNHKTDVSQKKTGGGKQSSLGD
jgi:hypothetical protein